MATRRKGLDRRRKDYTPHTEFQRWLKEKMDARDMTYKDVFAHLVMTRFNENDGGITENHIYRLARQDPAHYPGAVRPGYELCYAIGQMFGDTKGALDAAGYPNNEPDPINAIGTPLAPDTLALLLATPLDTTPAHADPNAPDMVAEPRAEYLRDALPTDVRAIRVSGECMSPLFADGDILIVIPQPSAKEGDLVIARVDDAALVCKRYRTVRGMTYLEPLNGEDIIPAPRFVILGVIAYFLRNVRRS